MMLGIDDLVRREAVTTAGGHGAGAALECDPLSDARPPDLS